MRLTRSHRVNWAGNIGVTIEVTTKPCACFESCMSMLVIPVLYMAMLSIRNAMTFLWCIIFYDAYVKHDKSSAYDIAFAIVACFVVTLALMHSHICIKAQLCMADRVAPTDAAWSFPIVCSIEQIPLVLRKKGRFLHRTLGQPILHVNKWNDTFGTTSTLAP